MNDSLAEGSAHSQRSMPSQTGLTLQPEGEIVRGHGGSTAEASPRTLAKRTQRGASTTPPSQEGCGGMGSECADPPANESDKDSFTIIRATTRFQVDLRALSIDDSKGREKGDKRVLSKDEKRARDILEDVSRLTTTARNVAMRANIRTDSDALDKVMAATGAMPRKTGDWAAKKLYSYKIVRAAVPALSSTIAATIQNAIDQKWRQVRYDVLVRQTESAPHYRLGQAFPVPTAAMRFTCEAGKYWVSVTLYASDHDGAKRLVVPLVPKDNHQKEVLQHLAEGDWRVGQATIERDRLKPSKWYLRLAYKRLVPKRKEGLSAAINRGISAFVVAVTESGEQWLYDGQDIEAYLKQIQRRRKAYQYASKASGRWGHGRARTLRPTKPLEDKAGRWRQTRCQVIARQLARWMAARGVATVYIEDFSGIRDGVPEKLEGGKWVWNRIQEWPYYQLQMRLISCLEEEGISTVIVPAEFISQRCPSCGHTDVKNRDLKAWKLCCGKCGWKRHLDVAAAMNILARGQAEKSVQP